MTCLELNCLAIQQSDFSIVHLLIISSSLWSSYKSEKFYDKIIASLNDWQQDKPCNDLLTHMTMVNFCFFFVFFVFGCLR
jgi:hypothetical protein